MGERDREIESVVVLSVGEMEGGRRATMWVSPHPPPHPRGEEGLGGEPSWEA